MYAAVVLAAGASTRFGSPKALIPIAGEAALSRMCRQLREAGCETTHVVVGAHADHIRPLVPRSAKAIDHREWERGRTGSLKAGLRALPATGPVLVWPVDHPCIETSTLTMILDGPGEIRVPTYRRRRGHPTLFGSSVREELLALADDQPLHDILHLDPGRVVEVPVQDSGILLNIDTPDDLKKLHAYLGRSAHARPSA